MNNETPKAGVEALAGGRGTSPAKASTIHYSLPSFMLKKESSYPPDAPETLLSNDLENNKLTCDV